MRTPVFDSFDKKTLIHFLGDVIEAEMEKPDGEIDLNLIEECDGFLAELLSDVTISDEQMAERIAKIKGKAGPAEIISVRPRRVPRMRRIIAAACAAVLLIGGSVTAYAFVPAFRDMVRNVLCLGQGSAVEDGGVTFIYSGKTATYQSIDELVQKENLDILYPHDLPDTLKIKSIIGSGEGENVAYIIGFVDNLATIDIIFGEGDVSTLSPETEKFVNSNNITSYIRIREKVIVSTTVHNGWTYYITTNAMDEMKAILENLY